MAPPPRTDFERAVAHDRAGNLEAAAASFRKAVAADPAHGWAWGGLGAVRGRQGRRREAVTALRQAARLEPGSAVIWSNLAVVLFQEGQRADALAAAQRCLAIDPGNAEARAVVGRAGG
jgi:Flp pilus assembly protein TadD